MLNDSLANVLNNIMNAARSGKAHCSAGVSSTLVQHILTIMKDQHYIGDFTLTPTRKGNPVIIHLLGTINKCCVIKPRFSVKKGAYEKFEKRFLPAKNFGILIVSTPKGVMTHTDAKEKGLGGKLIAYVY